MKNFPVLASLLVSLAACNGTDPDTVPRETPPPVTLACPAPSHGPTVHEGDVKDGEVWRADEGPHLVRADVNVRNAAKLTIEPCAVVEVSARASLRVAFPGTPGQGSLFAEGTAERPITFRRAGTEAWGHLLVHTPGSAKLAHVTLDGGGAGDPSGASLILQGDGALPSDAVVAVDQVTVKGSRGLGVKASGGARFVTGSNALVVTGSGGRPVEIGALGLVGFPRGTYTGNAIDEIHVASDTNLLESATLQDVGVPYWAGVPGSSSLRVGGRSDKEVVTLTIEPGVHLRMEKGGALEIERATGPFPATGVLVAVGTATAPIVMSSHEAAPLPGDWRGLWFGGIARAENRVEHVRVEHTGADCGCVLVTCSAGVTGYHGAFIFTQEPARAFVKDSTITAGSGHAFVLGYTGSLVDFASQNTVEGMTGCAQTLPSSVTCPAPRPVCK
ncbi:MAG: hypothetical protein JNL79_07155 [Myxococcales bacterium]|nr:hypothetical protein [Myxococcales bacterium]